MALTKEDLRLIGSLMDEKFKQADEKTDEKFDDLKTLTQKEFMAQNERIDKRFNEVDKKFDEVDKRFNEVDKRFDDVDKRFNVVENKINSNHGAMVSEFIKIHHKIDRINKRTFEDEEAMAGDIVGLKKRVTKLEKLKAV